MPIDIKRPKESVAEHRAFVGLSSRRDPRREYLPRRMMTVAEAAHFLNVHERTIHRWIRSGILVAHQVRRQWRVAPEAIELLLNRRASWHRVNAP